jgi:hypothetical protein
MPSVSNIVSFLDKYNALELGGSPWPSYDESDGDIYHFDWPGFFDNADDDNLADIWVPRIGGFLNDLGRNLGQGNLGPDSDRGVSYEEEESRPTWDVCAWYQPIHYFGMDWGLFVKENCMLQEALEIAKFLPYYVLGWPLWRIGLEVIRASFSILYLHEHYHHKMESLGLRLQVVELKSRYLAYKKKVYRRTNGTDDQLEEALANASAYRRLNTRPYNRINRGVREAARKYLDARFPFDPPGYRKGMDYLEDDSFNSGENLLQARMHEARLVPTQPSSEWDFAPDMIRSQFGLNDNIWTIVSPGGTSVLPTSSITPLYLPTTRQARRLAEKFGFSEKRGRNPHLKLTRNGEMINIPTNRERVSPVVVHNLCEALNIKKGELAELIRNL